VAGRWHVDSNEIVLGLGAEPNGLTSAQVRRIIADIDRAVDLVGFTIAEFIPRQVMHLQQILKGFRSSKIQPPPADNRRG
jgi:arginase